MSYSRYLANWFNRPWAVNFTRYKKPPLTSNTYTSQFHTRMGLQTNIYHIIWRHCLLTCEGGINLIMLAHSPNKHKISWSNIEIKYYWTPVWLIGYVLQIFYTPMFFSYGAVTDPKVVERGEGKMPAGGLKAWRFWMHKNTRLGYSSYIGGFVNNACDFDTISSRILF